MEGYQIYELLYLTEGGVAVFVRPENIILSKGNINSSTRNIINGKIVDVTQFGQLFRIWLDKGLKFIITKQSVEELGLTPGTTVYASFKATASHIISRL